MLKELNIKNFAIIDQLRVEFAPGLNVFTGETGAGKSIVVDALNLALGERAGADLIVRRVLAASGKNKVYINGSLANLSTLAALGVVLADIHGQHEHQSLLSLERQTEMLDSFGGLTGLRDALLREYRRLQELRAELGGLEAGEREKAQREDMLRYQKNEIETARLKPGEDEALVKEQKLLANSEKLSSLSRTADDALYSSEGAALSDLKKAITGMREIVAIDNRLAAALELCEAGRVQIEEAAREVSAYAERVEFDPKRLEEIGDRIDLLQRLKKKYGGTVDEVLEFAEKAAAELDRIERSGEEIERLKREIAGLRSELTAKAQELTKKRKVAARELEKKVEAELGHLGMKKTKFSVKITQEPGEDPLDGVKIGPRGADRVEFLISPNPGEEPRPLAKIASGGELSRIMLALKTILVEGDHIPTLVFDEVDAGIGGAVAEEVGRRLRRIAEKRQVFCITHLPQIASMATHHYGVAKSLKKERTSTDVTLLGRKERVDEVARMLGGRTISEATIQHAQEMIERGNA